MARKKNPEMFQKQTSHESIRRLLTSGFTARDIAEPLVSFDAESSGENVRKSMLQQRLRVAGVRRNGLVFAKVAEVTLGEGPCSAFAEPFTVDELASDNTPLAELVQRLADRDQVFITIFGGVCGIVTKTDLVKPAVRMWLFGMITIIEMRLQRLIEHHLPRGEWEPLVSAARLEKGRELQLERHRRHQDVDLLDCLQMSDKAQIVFKHEPLREALRIESRRQAERVFKQIESLRNNLAHSQDIVTANWEAIVMLAGNLERVIQGPSDHPDLLERTHE